MKKKEKEIIKTLIEKIAAPMAAIVASVIVLSKYLIDYGKDTKYIEILITIAASIIGAIIASTLLRILRQKREGNVFISYNHKDKKFVERIVQSLKFKRFNI